MSLNAHLDVDTLLAGTGVALNGSNPWDPHVADRARLQAALAHGTLGVAEAYIDRQWDCDRLDEMLYRILRAGVDRRLSQLRRTFAALLSWLINPQSGRRAFAVGARHYDIGDDLYSRMLDRRMIYSCAYWRDARTLDEAQEAKLDLVCRKLRLAPGMRVLDIGCGWGGALQFAAERYGVQAVGVTVSANQARIAADRCAGLPVEIRLQDYRAVEGRFDRIWSLGMLEHVGHRNYGRYFDAARRLLADDGLFLAHSIVSMRSRRANDPFIERHIFPNSQIPSMAQIATAIEGRFVVEDWHGFGPDYDRTLMEWCRRFDAAWPELGSKYGERFRRMWRFWLLASAAAFRARRNHLCQVLLSPLGVPGGLAEVR
ncbi:MAG: cyclopropane fatty acyl phospholipid synthase [Gammaproteobacteria bacterium]